MVDTDALIAERTKLAEKVEAGEITVEEASRQVREFVAAQEAVPEPVVEPAVPEPAPEPIIEPTPPPVEMVEVQVEARKQLGGLSPGIVSPPPPVPVSEKPPEPVPEPTPEQVPEPTQVQFPVTLTPEEVEAGKVQPPVVAIPTPEAGFEAAQREAEVRLEDVETRRFFGAGEFTQQEKLEGELAKEIQEDEAVLADLRQLGIPIVGEETVEPIELRNARLALKEATEGIEAGQTVSPTKFQQIRAARLEFNLQFGAFYKIGPEELQSRLDRAKARGLLDKLDKEQAETLVAQTALREHVGTLSRQPGETEQQFSQRLFERIGRLDLEPRKIRAAEGLTTFDVLEEPFAGAAEAREILGFVDIRRRGEITPRKTFAGELFQASVDVEREAGPIFGPGLAALGQIGARIVGSFEETTRFLGEITGTQPRGDPTIRAPSLTSPFVGLFDPTALSPLELQVDPARRLASAAAAGAIFLPLETKVFTAGTRAAGKTVKSFTRTLGKAALGDIKRTRVFREVLPKVRVTGGPLGQLRKRIGLPLPRSRRLRIDITVAKDRPILGTGEAVANRFQDILEGIQLRHPTITKPVELFFGKPEAIQLGEVTKVITKRTVSIAGRGGIAGREIVEETIERFKFTPIGDPISRRQFTQLLSQFGKLDPTTAGVRGRALIRTLGTGGKAAKLGVAVVDERPGAEVLRILAGEAKVRTVGFGRDFVAIGDVTAELRSVPQAFEAPLGLRGRISRFFRPTTQRRFFRPEFGERGARIGEITPRRPIGVETLNIPGTELRIRNIPEIVVRKITRRKLPRSLEASLRGAQQVVPPESFVVRAVVDEPIRIAAKPLKEAAEEFFKVIPAKQVGPMKPFEFLRPPPPGFPLARIQPSGVIPTPSDLGGALADLISSTRRATQQGLISARLVTGVPVAVATGVRGGITRALITTTGIVALHVSQEGVRVGDRLEQQSRALTRSRAKTQERLRDVVSPTPVVRPIQQQFPRQQQRIEERLAQTVVQAPRLVTPPVPITIVGRGGVPFRPAVPFPPLEEEPRRKRPRELGDIEFVDPSQRIVGLGDPFAVLAGAPAIPFIRVEPFQRITKRRRRN